MRRLLPCGLGVALDPAAVAAASPLPQPAAPAAGGVPVAVLLWGGLALLLPALACAGLYLYWRPLLYYGHLRAAGASTGSTPPQTRRERRGAGYWALARRALKLDRYCLAAFYARRARKLFPGSPDTPIMEGFIHHKRGRHDLSYGIFSGIYRSVPEGSERAGVACLCAHAAMKLDRPEAALEWLRQASLDHFPTLAQEVQDALYDPLRSDNWFRLVRERSPGLGIGAGGWDPSIA